MARVSVLAGSCTTVGSFGTLRECSLRFLQPTRRMTETQDAHL